MLEKDRIQELADVERVARPGLRNDVGLMLGVCRVHVVCVVRVICVVFVCSCVRVFVRRLKGEIHILKLIRRCRHIIQAWGFMIQGFMV